MTVLMSASISDRVTLVKSSQAFVYMINYLTVLPIHARIGAYCNLSASTTSLCIMLGSSLMLIGRSILLGFSATGVTFLIAVATYTLDTGLPVGT